MARIQPVVDDQLRLGQPDDQRTGSGVSPNPGATINFACGGRAIELLKAPAEETSKLLHDSPDWGKDR